MRGALCQWYRARRGRENFQGFANLRHFHFNIKVGFNIATDHVNIAAAVQVLL